MKRKQVDIVNFFKKKQPANEAKSQQELHVQFGMFN